MADAEPEVQEVTSRDETDTEPEVQEVTPRDEAVQVHLARREGDQNQQAASDHDSFGALLARMAVVWSADRENIMANIQELREEMSQLRRIVR